MCSADSPTALGLHAGLEAAGLNLAAVLEPSLYDELVAPAWRIREVEPATASVVILAAGGQRLFRRYRAWRSERTDAGVGAAARPSQSAQLDAFVAAQVDAACAELRERGRRASWHAYLDERAGRYADMVALGRAAGLGASSRLGLLLHPRYGPWMSLRALLFTDLVLPACRPDPEFEPCTGCAAPCASACPVAAPRSLSSGGFDVGACASEHTAQGQCASACAARRACVVGPEHAYDSDAEAHHMRAAQRALKPHL